MAKLIFSYGAMNSGKTTALMQAAYNYEERGMEVIIIKPSIDTKGEDTIKSRLGVDRKVDILVRPEDNLLKYTDLFSTKDCIFADEAQFLNEKQILQLRQIVSKYNVPVMCYGLRADFQGKGFPGSIELLLMSDELRELKTICECGKIARFNARKVNGEFVSEGAQVAIDETDDVTYESLCAKCYAEKVQPFAKVKL
jgi:thymidine kinase